MTSFKEGMGEFLIIDNGKALCEFIRTAPVEEVRKILPITLTQFCGLPDDALEKHLKERGSELP